MQMLVSNITNIKTDSTNFGYSAKLSCCPHQSRNRVYDMKPKVYENDFNAEIYYEILNKQSKILK